MLCVLDGIVENIQVPLHLPFVTVKSVRWLNERLSDRSDASLQLCRETLMRTLSTIAMRQVNHRAHVMISYWFFIIIMFIIMFTIVI